MKRLVRFSLVVLVGLVATFAIFEACTNGDNIRRQRQLEHKIGDWQVKLWSQGK